MAITKERKDQLVAEYIEELQASQGVIMVDYRGLRVSDMERLRKSLRETDVSLRVVKNRLLKLALEQMGMEMPQEWLLGPAAAAFCRGEVPPAAKVISDFAKDIDLLSIKGGLLEGASLAPEQVSDLAKLPSREVMLAQVLGTINAPATQAAGVIAGGIRQVLNVLQAYVEKLEGNSPSPQAA